MNSREPTGRFCTGWKRNTRIRIASEEIRGRIPSRFDARLLEIAAFHKRHRRQINVALKGLADLLIR